MTDTSKTLIDSNQASGSEQRAILLRYHEVALKGGNRRKFEDLLARNAVQMIRKETSDYSSPIGIQKRHGRILLNADWNSKTRDALSKVFGLSSFSPMIHVETNVPSIVHAALQSWERAVKANGLPRSFRVKARRSDKVIPETSVELNHRIGSEILKRYPQLKVDLDHAELSLEVEVRRGTSFICVERGIGPGGLPVGSNGPALCLMSGGIDSPIAALEMIKRGSTCHFIHFYGTPFVGQDALEKVEDLVRKVNQYQPQSQSLTVIPFGNIQEKIALATPPRMRTILYRRMMIRIAERVARQEGILALVTGESLGQVASQTMENLTAVNAVATLPILRPLITHDKDEIIAKSHKWGTFSISTRPAIDCCTLFADRHPILRANPETLLEEEQNFDVQEFVDQGLSQLKTIG